MDASQFPLAVGAMSLVEEVLGVEALTRVWASSGWGVWIEFRLLQVAYHVVNDQVVDVG